MATREQLWVFRLFPLALTLRPENWWSCMFWALPWLPGHVLAERLHLSTDPHPLVEPDTPRGPGGMGSTSPARSIPLLPDGSLFLYAGLPGEPALGPSERIDPMPQIRMPESPLDPHWLDASELALGVLTLGGNRGPLKWEVSSFSAKAPQEERIMGPRGLDSWATRLTYHASPMLAMQLSVGQWQGPLMAEQSLVARRLTASATYQLQQPSSRWKTTVALGLNDQRSPDQSVHLPGWMVESSYVLNRHHTFYGRIEEMRPEGPLESRDLVYGHAIPVSKVSFGYVFDSLRAGSLNLGIGALKGIYSMPSELDPRYGARPSSYLIFLQGHI